MILIIRKYTFDPSKSEEITRHLNEGFLPLVKKTSGLISYHWFDNGNGTGGSVGMIPMMAVAKAFHGKNCSDGKNYSVTIMEDVLTKAREHKYHEVCLTVHHENSKAIRLYERHGFQKLSGPDGRGNLQMMMLLD